MDGPYLCMMEPSIDDLNMALIRANLNNFSKIVFPIHHTELPLEFDNPLIAEQMTDNAYPDLIITGSEWNEKTIVMLSDTIDCDSADPLVRKQSEQVLLHDFSLAENLVNKYNIMVRVKSGNSVNLARLCAGRRRFLPLFVLVPAHRALAHHKVWRRDKKKKIPDSKVAEYDGWIWWNNFRWISSHRQLLRVVVEFHHTVPKIAEVFRWLCEPLEAIIIPTSIFKVHGTCVSMELDWHEVLTYFMRAKTSIIVSGNTDDMHWRAYSNYLIDFRESLKNSMEMGDHFQLRESFCQSCYPINPRLSCAQLIAFEGDVMKYVTYRNAIAEVLTKCIPEKRKKLDLAVIMIINAGRGALVREALVASMLTGRKVRIYAFESDPPTAHSLKKAVSQHWKDWNISVVVKDPRDFKPIERADLIVCEFYGIYGDAELAPEFLDCTNDLLKEGGVLIPQKFTTHISPVMSPILNNIVNFIGRVGEEYCTRYRDHFKHSESCFTTVLGSAFYIDLDSPLHEFTFPNRSSNKDYTYHKVLNFVSKMDGELNGLSGHYELTLSDTVTLSNCRFSKTHGLESWYPMYFPFTYPISVKKGEKIEVHIWRCSDTYKIWYEWCCVLPRKTTIHNLSGIIHPMYFRHE